MKLCLLETSVSISHNEKYETIEAFKKLALAENLTVGNYVAIGKPEDLFNFIYELSFYYSLEIV